MASVRLEHLSKTYRGGVSALHDLTVTIPNGEFVCILGPSGSGKSTALKLMAGIEEASAGRIFFDDEDVTVTTPERRDIAMVFQSYGLYPQMTVAENIAFPLMLRKVPKAERARQVEEVCKLLGIGKLLRRYPRQLSGGERQRVALGRAIVRNPRVFLLDEPLSNLDANLRVSMRQELRRLHEILGATFIYVTHDQDDALSMGDRVLVLNEGRLQQYDAATRVYQYPANRFVASFLGRLPMNFFQGTVHMRGEIVVFENADVRLAVPSGKPPVAGTATLGVRPDAIVVRAAHPGDQGLAGMVRWLELVQPDLYATVEVGSHRIIAKVPEGEPIEVGHPAQLHFAPSKLHLFDPTTGVRLNPPPEEGMMAERRKREALA
ncbi:MAG: ABC transporter ATP-binding protein [Candidatus Dormibacteraeota bacterium]|nr:ABC transporter ATP-binding protein [Candidatus Dormibacteraeota bacterium]